MEQKEYDRKLNNLIKKKFIFKLFDTNPVDI